MVTTITSLPPSHLLGYSLIFLWQVQGFTCSHDCLGVSLHAPFHFHCMVILSRDITESPSQAQHNENVCIILWFVKQPIITWMTIVSLTFIDQLTDAPSSELYKCVHSIGAVQKYNFYIHFVLPSGNLFWAICLGYRLQDSLLFISNFCLWSILLAPDHRTCTYLPNTHWLWSQEFANTLHGTAGPEREVHLLTGW